MTDITPEQRAAVEWLESLASMRSNPPARAHASLILDALPAELANPQPELPTEPGWYTLPADSDQKHMDVWHTDGQEVHYLNSVGNWVDMGWGGPSLRESRPFTRLVPERPTITREQIAKAAVISSDSRVVDNILALVNGKGAES